MTEPTTLIARVVPEDEGWGVDIDGVRAHLAQSIVAAIAWAEAHAKSNRPSRLELAVASEPIVLAAYD
jgi:hypothetical protein